METTARKFPPLYKIGARGQVQVWDVEVVNRDGAGVIKISWGEQGGKIQTTEEIVREGKNLGRKNETTPMEQAVDQARSRWEKQKDRYYAENLDEAAKLQTKLTRPMLAHKFEDRQHKLEAGDAIYTQPKLDGMRCIAICEGGEIRLVSRGEKPITAVPHIVEVLSGAMQEGDIWDGELYRDGYRLEDIIAACRREEAGELSLAMQFHAFDAVAPESYHDRFLSRALQQIVALPSRDIVTAVSTKEVEYDPEKVQAWLREYEEAGYEGMIVRLAAQQGYEHKRTANLLKVKSFTDAEFMIVGSETAKPGNRKHGLLVNFVLETMDASGKTVTFKATLMGEEDILRQMWQEREQFVGQYATAKFQDLTKKGIPHFAKVKAVRWEGDSEPRIRLDKNS